MITFPTTRPQALLSAFKKAIADKSIATWDEDKDGDFFHKAAQWTERAWLRPEVEASVALRFTIIFHNEEAEKRAVYAFHSTRIVETFINHFPSMFSPQAGVTPNASGDDSKF